VGTHRRGSDLLRRCSGASWRARPDAAHEPGPLFCPVSQIGEITVRSISDQAVYAILQSRAKKAKVRSTYRSWLTTTRTHWWPCRIGHLWTPPSSGRLISHGTPQESFEAGLKSSHSVNHGARPAIMKVTHNESGIRASPYGRWRRVRSPIAFNSEGFPRGGLDARRRS
jgi:hypothetical protein